MLFSVFVLCLFTLSDTLLRVTMDNPEKLAITIEYINMYNHILFFWPKLWGCIRFKTEKSRIVSKSMGSVIYGIFVIFLINLSATRILYVSGVRDKVLFPEEIIITMQVTVILNIFWIEFSFINIRTGSELVNRSINIDTILGARETKSMRDLIYKINLMSTCAIFLTQIIVVTALYISFNVAMEVHVLGSIFFALLVAVYNDVNFVILQYAFLSMRVRYLNVAIMKMSNMKLEYVPDLFLFNGIFWKKSFDNQANNHERLEPKKIMEAFKMIIEQLRRLERFYRFVVSN